MHMRAKNPDKSGLDEFKKVYLFPGETDPRRESAVDDLVAQLVDAESTTFDLEEFDGNASTAESILSAVNMAPFASEKKVVIVDRVDRLSPRDQTEIAAFLPKLGERSCLILLAGEDASSQSKRGRTSRGKEEDEAFREGADTAGGLYCSAEDIDIKESLWN